MGCKFLPPYSPDYNPIELAFSAMKYNLRRDGAYIRLAMTSTNYTEIFILSSNLCTQSLFLTFGVGMNTVVTSSYVFSMLFYVLYLFEKPCDLWHYASLIDFDYTYTYRPMAGKCKKRKKEDTASEASDSGQPIKQSMFWSLISVFNCKIFSRFSRSLCHCAQG
jgi:hypothetical protein